MKEVMFMSRIGILPLVYELFDPGIDFTLAGNNCLLLKVRAITRKGANQCRFHEGEGIKCLPGVERWHGATPIRIGMTYA